MINNQGLSSGGNDELKIFELLTSFANAMWLLGSKNERSQQGYYKLFRSHTITKDYKTVGNLGTLRTSYARITDFCFAKSRKTYLVYYLTRLL